VKKGVSLIFEQVMLFLIGIMIFLACFSIFRSYEYHFSNSIMNEHLEEVSDWVVSNIMGFSREDGVNSTLRVTVPELVGNEHYKINLTQSGLNITTLQSGRTIFSPLARINRTFSLDGAFSTVHGSEFVIYKRGTQIIIG
jgi:hypothetical protein